MLKYELDITEERDDLYRKLKDAFDVLASIMVNDEADVGLRIRAVNGQVQVAKILRLYLKDEEHIQTLEQEVEALKKEFAKRSDRSRIDGTR